MPYDVAILGGGLAGLTLGLQLVRENKRVAILDRRPSLPPPKQKVGESTVQVGGYYLGKVLDLEAYLLESHLMKYNLRFYWKTNQDPNQFENYAQTYLREFSNIPCYQTDRNALEAHLIQQLEGKADFYLGIRNLAWERTEDDCHTLRFDLAGDTELKSPWLVDTTGRSGFLARQLDLNQETEIDHGASFFWVDGRIDIETLTDQSAEQRRRHPGRRHTGHLPQWLATNHFMGDGYWLWVIPLPTKTSIGLVWDNRIFDGSQVAGPENLRKWIEREFPLFQRALEGRPTTDSGGYKGTSYGCTQTLSKDRWAISGEAGRFSDPLYSPGTDLIALHNTLIHHSICHLSPKEFEQNQFLYELLLKSLFDAFLPSFHTSYEALGDQETFTLKYTWELSVYFSFFTFPFLGGHFCEQAFILPFLEKFGELGPVNRNLHQFLRDYKAWKASHQPTPGPLLFHELSDLTPLKKAADTFYEVDLNPTEALVELDRQLESLQELARFLVVHTICQVTGRPELVTHPELVSWVTPETASFDPELFEKTVQPLATPTKPHQWSFDPHALKRFGHPSWKATA